MPPIGIAVAPVCAVRVFAAPLIRITLVPGVTVPSVEILTFAEAVTSDPSKSKLPALAEISITPVIVLSPRSSAPPVWVMSCVPAVKTSVPPLLPLSQVTSPVPLTVRLSTLWVEPPLSPVCVNVPALTVIAPTTKAFVPTSKEPPFTFKAPVRSRSPPRATAPLVTVNVAASNGPDVESVPAEVINTSASRCVCPTPVTSENETVPAVPATIVRFRAVPSESSVDENVMFPSLPPPLFVLSSTILAVSVTGLFITICPGLVSPSSPVKISPARFIAPPVISNRFIVSLAASVPTVPTVTVPVPAFSVISRPVPGVSPSTASRSIVPLPVPPPLVSTVTSVEIVSGPFTTTWFPPAVDEVVMFPPRVTPPVPVTVRASISFPLPTATPPAAPMDTVLAPALSVTVSSTVPRIPASALIAPPVVVTDRLLPALSETVAVWNVTASPLLMKAVAAPFAIT